MSRPDFFIELFPVNANQVPPLSAYALQVQADAEQSARAIGDQLAYRLDLIFPGSWFYAAGHIVTDAPASPAQMEISLDLLRKQMPDLYAGLASLDEAPSWQAGPATYADYCAQAIVRNLHAELQAILAQMTLRVHNASIMRDYLLDTWVCDGEGALSLTVQAHVRYHQRVDELLATGHDPTALVGMRVMDRTSTSMVAEVLGPAGVLAEHRERLLTLTRREALQDMLRAAPDDEPVLLLRNRNSQSLYTSSTLYLLLPTHAGDVWARFGLDVAATRKALHLPPDQRAQIVRAVSDVLKKHAVVGNAYNSRTHPHLFGLIDTMPDVEFGNQRVQPYNSSTIASEFSNHNVYQRNPRFTDAPIKVAVINALSESASDAGDFVEAMRRELASKHNFQIELIRERSVRVVNEKNIESAVRKVEKDEPHIVLAFFAGDSPDDQAHHRHLKAITTGKGIASHTIYQAVMHNVDAMPIVIMGLLAKTGNLPYVLAEPMDFADRVVGLALIREQTRQFDRITGVSRIYSSNGAFLRYVIHQEEVDPGDTVPLVVMQKLFPEDLLANQRVLVHHAGRITAQTRQRLGRWGQVIGAQIAIAELLQGPTPRIYSLTGQISAPPWGSICRLSDAEALMVTTADAPTPQPMHVCVQPDAYLTIEQALYSVLAWTLLHYSMGDLSRLPVTTLAGDELAAWLAAGMLPEAIVGDVPFWL